MSAGWDRGCIRRESWGRLVLAREPVSLAAAPLPRCCVRLVLPQWRQLRSAPQCPGGACSRRPVPASKVPLSVATKDGSETGRLVFSCLRKIVPLT
jgi:hypothetical protein